MSEWFETYGFGEVHDGLLIGAYPLDARDVAALQRMSVRRVLNLVEDEEYEPGSRSVVEAALAGAAIEEHRMRLTDFGRLPADRLEVAAGVVAEWLDDEQLSYVHCRAGRQRSAAVAAGAIALHDRMEIEDALVYVQQGRPSADPLPHQQEDLFAWWYARGSQRID